MISKMKTRRRRKKRFQKRIDKHIPFAIPSLTVGIAASLEEFYGMEEYKRRFPLWGYRWKQAARDKNEK